ncbi:MAG TPA: ChaN family lipoprotein [Burkholderiales bacterium]|nr:ChaN family lipoprotein [Burkholderiales bacterium]
MRAFAFAAALLASAGACAQPCLRPGEWFSTTGETPHGIPASVVLAASAQREVVLLGEQHDVADDHVWQLATLAALHGARPQMAIGFEQFPRRVQPVLDAWIAGRLTEKQFLEQSEWREVWSYPPELYLPLFRFARINGIPMIALNVDRELIDAVATKGWDGVPDALKDGVSRPAPASKAYLDMLRRIYKEHPQRDGAEFAHFVDSQLTWDRAMAEALARGRSDARPLVVGIIGSGHLRFGYGVRHQLRALGVDNVATLLPVAADSRCEQLGADIADAVFAIPQPLAKDAPPPPRLGVRLELSQDGVAIVEVTPGSLAAASGLKNGDRIVSLAGAPVRALHTVIDAVRGQPAGTWLPIQVRRGDDTLDVIVKFPPKE